MIVKGLEVSEWGYAVVLMTVALASGREKKIVLFREFCRREECTSRIQAFFDKNECIPRNYIHAVFKPTPDVVLLK